MLSILNHYRSDADQNHNKKSTRIQIPSDRMAILTVCRQYTEERAGR